MGFPTNELKCAGGEMYSHIFENKRVNLKREIFWALTINFLPIRYCDETHNCSFTIEWMKFPFKNWLELNHFHLEGNYGDNGTEASFYVVEHDCAQTFDIKFTYKKDNIFNVSFVSKIDFTGLTGDDADSNLIISGDTDIEYKGLWVIPANLENKPNKLSEITKIAANYIALNSYNNPFEDRKDFSYLFSPKIG